MLSGINLLSHKTRAIEYIMVRMLLFTALVAYIGLLVEESNTLLGWGNMVEREIEVKSLARERDKPLPSD
jgi:hypothetical protein